MRLFGPFRWFEIPLCLGNCHNFFDHPWLSKRCTGRFYQGDGAGRPTWQRMALKPGLLTALSWPGASRGDHGMHVREGANPAPCLKAASRLWCQGAGQRPVSHRRVLVVESWPSGWAGRAGRPRLWPLPPAHNWLTHTCTGQVTK